MKNLILISYEFITVLLPATVVIVILSLLYKKQKGTYLHILYLIIFSVYLFGIFHYTRTGTLYDAKLYGLEFNVNQINLIPFSDMEIDFVAYGLNVILFMPLGFLLPFIWSNFEKYKSIITCSISLSAIIEISQLLNNRRTDIDDLILNTIGAIIGLILFKLFSRITNHNTVQNTKYKYEMIILISVAFLCRFLTYNEFGMAKILFGF